jgi:multidrug efflux pump subunit AcrA (membrane-fusion protein)
MMPSVDSISQSQSVLIKLPPGKMIPQNLIAKVRIIKMDKENAASLPRQAVLSDETQTSFWVMKMIDSVTAVKVPITKGIETGSRIEILNPRFGRGDQIVLTGNYGLADTAHVKIAVQEE